jgi:hypothetical protein|tara:strand:+ start:112 stop:498 length:387 start_codon:yes stop_codon:yes gene_type:complete
MAKNTITFDTSSGVAYGVNLNINTGADFNSEYTVVNTSGSAFDFTSWTGSSQLAKSVSIGSSSHAIETFTVGFTSAAGGVFKISLGKSRTRTIPEGRYVYDVNVSSGSTTYRIVSGDVLVIPGISSAA